MTLGEPLVSMVEWSIQALEALGVAVILGGFVFATLRWPLELRRRGAHRAYIAYRRHSAA